MKIFRKNRLILYIIFAVAAIAVISFVIISKLNSNFLLGEWETDDKNRKYVFDENTLTISSKLNDYSVLYGYTLKDGKTLVLQRGDEVKSYTVIIQGSEISIYSPDSDSPEILHRV